MAERPSSRRGVDVATLGPEGHHAAVARDEEREQLSGRQLRRHRPLERGKPLSRGKPLERGRKALARRSEKGKRRDRERAKVRAAVLQRDGHRCVGVYVVPELRCWGPLDVDEIRPRGRGGDELDVDNCQTLCRGHHDWKHAHPEEAQRRGLTRPGA